MGRGTRGGRSGPRVMRTVAKEVRRLASVEAEREVRLREGTADLHDRLATRHDKTDWYGLRHEIHEEADTLLSGARLEVVRAISEKERVEKFVAVIDQGLKPGARPIAQRTATNVYQKWLSAPDSSKPAEDALLERLGVRDVAELAAIVNRARTTTSMDDHQRAEACERFLVRYYNTQGRARQRLGIRSLGGELPPSPEESQATVEP